jgi:hypothetical protein
VEMTITVAEKKLRGRSHRAARYQHRCAFLRRAAFRVRQPTGHQRAVESGDFVGDVSQGGSCNCDIIHFCAHTNGTHTECVGHITREPIFVTEMLRESFFPATLITVIPERADATSEAYEPTPQKHDF